MRMILRKTCYSVKSSMSKLRCIFFLICQGINLFAQKLLCKVIARRLTYWSGVIIAHN